MANPVTRAGEPEADTFPWGSITWHHSDKIDPDSQQTFGFVFINPGENNPPHYHPNCEEVLYVVSGTCTHTYGDDAYDLQAGDSIRVPQGIVHNAINKGWEPVRCIISFSSGDRQTVFLEE